MVLIQENRLPGGVIINTDNKNNKNHLSKKIFWSNFSGNLVIRILGYACLLALLSTVIFVFVRAIQFFHEKGLATFFHHSWYANKQAYGIGNVMLNTVFVLLIVFIFVVPLTIFSALFINEYFPIWLKKRIQLLVKILAGIPSVVFGLLGLTVINTFFLQKISHHQEALARTGLFLTCLILVLMILPLTISLTLDALQAIPQRVRFNAAALGARKEIYCWNLLLKRIWPRVLGAFLLGIARVLGETMAVLMISGNDPNGLKIHSGLMHFLYSQVATLASLIGWEILESTTQLHTSALYAVGLLLFFFVFIINLLVFLLSSSTKWGRRLKYNKHSIKKTHHLSKLNDNESNLENIKITDKKNYHYFSFWLILFFLVTSTLIVISLTMMMITTIFWRGIIQANFADFVASNNNDNSVALLPSFLVTLLLLFLTLILVIPLALATAFLSSEYLKSYKKSFTFLNLCLNVFTSTPSIVYGLFGLYFFIFLLHIPQSVLAGALTLTLLILPMLTRNFIEGFLAVPQRLRRASLSLGATKCATNFRIVLKESTLSTINAILLSAGRILGESAPIYLTLSTTVAMPIAGFLSPGASMSTHILNLWRTGATATVNRAMYELAALIMFLIGGCALLGTLVNYYCLHGMKYSRMRFWKNLKKNSKIIK